AGALLVGVNFAKGLAYARQKPLLGINHLEGHVYANWLDSGRAVQEPTFPLVALIVSGGHSDLVLSQGHGRYRRLGRTRDDAASFQAAVVEVLATKAARAARTFGARCLALGGGVAANRSLLRRVEELADIPVVCPPPRLCTDNAAMIAAAGFFRYRAGERADL